MNANIYLTNKKTLFWRVTVKVIPLIIIIYSAKPCLSGLWGIVDPNGYMSYFHPNSENILYLIHPLSFVWTDFLHYLAPIIISIAVLKKKTWAYYITKWMILSVFIYSSPIYYSKISTLLNYREQLLKPIFPISSVVIWDKIYSPLISNSFELILIVFCCIIWCMSPIKKQFEGYSILSKIEYFISTLFHQKKIS